MLKAAISLILAMTLFVAPVAYGGEQRDIGRTLDQIHKALMIIKPAAQLYVMEKCGRIMWLHNTGRKTNFEMDRWCKNVLKTIKKLK